MYFFKTVDSSDGCELEDGQCLVKNVSVGLLRAATPAFLVPPNTLVVVSSNDPRVVSNLANKRLVKIDVTPAPSKVTTKKSQKKNVVDEEVAKATATEEVVVDETVSATTDEKNSKTETSSKEIPY